MENTVTADHRALAPGKSAAVLELTVNNHPGVMSHVCGLFARRAYNLEGIVCLPLGDGSTSRMWLWVNEEEKLDQVIKQLSKLEDVRRLGRCEQHPDVFSRLPW